MGTTWDESFAKIVNELHNLEVAWIRAKDEGLDAFPIVERIRELHAQMSDEQLRVYGEYENERASQAARDVRRYKEMLAEAEVELARRKKKVG
jgi:hypothetical protein